MAARRMTRRDEAGASAVEYGLLIAGIAALIVAVVFAFGGMVTDAFTNSCNTINTENVAHGGQTHSCE